MKRARGSSKKCEQIIVQGDTHTCYYAAILNGFLYSKYFTYVIVQQFIDYIRSLSSTELRDFHDNHVNNPGFCLQTIKKGARKGKIMKNFFAFMYTHFIDKGARAHVHPVDVPVKMGTRLYRDSENQLREVSRTSEVASVPLDFGGHSIKTMSLYMYLLDIPHAMIPIQALELYQERPDIFKLPDAHVLVAYQQADGISIQYQHFIFVCMGKSFETLRKNSRVAMTQEDFDRYLELSRKPLFENQPLTLGQAVKDMYETEFGLKPSDITGFEIFLSEQTYVLQKMAELLNDIEFAKVREPDEPGLLHFAKKFNPDMPYSLDLVPIQGTPIEHTIGPYKLDFACLDICNEPHTVVGVMCDGRQYVIDSGAETMRQKRWIKAFDRNDCMMHNIVIYVREDLEQQNILNATSFFESRLREPLRDR